MPAVSPSATASSAAPGTYCHGLPAPPRIRVDTATRRTMSLLDAPSWDRGAHRRRRRDEQHRSMNPADLMARHATQLPLTSPRSRRELAASRPCHRVGRCPTPRQDCVGQRAASCAPSRPPAAKAQRAGSMAARSLAQGCVGQGDQRSIIASIHPVDNPVGMLRHSADAHDGQPERREDQKYAVEVTSIVQRIRASGHAKFPVAKPAYGGAMAAAFSISGAASKPSPMIRPDRASKERRPPRRTSRRRGRRRAGRGDARWMGRGVARGGRITAELDQGAAT